jgi:hypothetical protein
MRLLTALVVIWLIIGVAAAAQRDYFKQDTVNCASAGTIAVTIVAGALNYVGANPQVDCPGVPQPSK